MVVTKPLPLHVQSRSPSTYAIPRAKATHSSSLTRQNMDATFRDGDTPSYEELRAGPHSSDEELFSEGSPRRRTVRAAAPLKKELIPESKSIGRRRKHPTSWLDFASRVFILVFLIYSLAVCPSDKEGKSPVCRGLAEYRRLVLEPYVILPLNNLLRHPSVSPYTQPVIDTARPVVERTRIEWETRIVPQWNAHAVPQFKKHIVPQWEKHVVAQWKKRVIPQWNAYVQPHLDTVDVKISPYRGTIRRIYANYVIPYATKVQVAAYKAKPYVVLAANKTYDAYQFSRPHIACLLRQTRHIPPLANKYVIKPLTSARRQFVDPHVALLVEKVKELSSGTFSTEDARRVKDDITSSSAPTPLSQAHNRVTVSSTPIKEHVASAESIVSASKFFQEDLASSEPGAPSSPIPDSGKADFATNEADVTAYTTQAAPTVFESSMTQTTTAAGGVDAKIIVGDNAGDHTVLAQFVTNSSEDDLDSFFDELGLDIEESSAEVLKDLPSAQQYVETDEEKAAREAARLAEIAEKRRDIMSRHTKWEEKLKKMMEEQTTLVHEALTSIRKTAAQELRTNARIREAVDTLHNEAEKALRGTDAYFSKLKKDGKSLDEKARLLDRVLAKVEAKFNERAQEVENIVNSWYQTEVMSKEAREIDRSSMIVKAVADDGQADIGLDYAWLDDVTYLDWQRYHALLDKHTEWIHEINAMANGTHATKPIVDPVVALIGDLQAEVQDITVGFETRLRRLRREGDRAFVSSSHGMSESADIPEPEFSALPIVGSEDAAAAKGKLKSRSKKEQEEEDKKEKVLQEVSDAILGRSAEEVVAAMRRVEELVQ